MDLITANLTLKTETFVAAFKLFYSCMFFFSFEAVHLVSKTYALLVDISYRVKKLFWDTPLTYTHPDTTKFAPGGEKKS